MNEVPKTSKDLPICKRAKLRKTRLTRPERRQIGIRGRRNTEKEMRPSSRVEDPGSEGELANGREHTKKRTLANTTMMNRVFRHHPRNTKRTPKTPPPPTNEKKKKNKTNKRNKKTHTPKKPHPPKGKEIKQNILSSPQWANDKVEKSSQRYGRKSWKDSFTLAIKISPIQRVIKGQLNSLLLYAEKEEGGGLMKMRYRAPDLHYFRIKKIKA